jgi:hypothetical protein
MKKCFNFCKIFYRGCEASFYGTGGTICFAGSMMGLAYIETADGWLSVGYFAGSLLFICLGIMLMYMLGKMVTKEEDVDKETITEEDVDKETITEEDFEPLRFR